MGGVFRSARGPGAPAGVTEPGKRKKGLAKASPMGE
jgi:hypothetical protein